MGDGRCAGTGTVAGTGPADERLGVVGLDGVPGAFAELGHPEGHAKVVVEPGAMLYMAMSTQEWPVVDGIVRASGFHWSSTIIWKKNALVLQRKDYHTQFEAVWYGWESSASRLCPLEDRTQSDVWEIDRPARSDEHPTMKPLELVARALRNSSHPGDLGFEPFSGSGTTLAAAESLGRLCYAMELDPKYVAAALERLALMGLEPRRIA